MQQIPNINIGHYLGGEMSPAERSAMLAELAAACEDHGFFLVHGHGCEALIEAMFAQSQTFFALPREQRLQIERDADNPLGYYDKELTKQKRDLKQVFDYKAGGHESSNPHRRSRWPQDMPEFKEVLSEFFERFTQLSEDTMALIFTALGMPEDQVRETMQQGFGELHTSSARLNYYPAEDHLPADERDHVSGLGDMALHHHTDPGAITLLIQDDHGGLQARSKRAGWIDVAPVAGSIVVNIGDVLQVWSNDRCTAGVHRVVPVHSERGRFSTPYFYQPRFDAVIEPWVEAGEAPRYRSFSWRDYIRGRVTDNFADYGEDDIQITKFAISAG